MQRQGVSGPNDASINICLELCKEYKKNFDVNNQDFEMRLNYFFCKTSNDSNTENINFVNRGNVDCTAVSSTTTTSGSFVGTSKQI